MNKWIIVSLLVSLISISLSSGLEFGCPGKESATMDINFSITPQISGLEIESGYDCSGNRYQFIIRNYENDDRLIYVDGNGVANEIWPDHGTKEVITNHSLTYCSSSHGWCSHPAKCEEAKREVVKGYSCFDNQICCKYKDVEEYNSWYEKSYFNDQTIPKKLGSEWTRTVYFKNNPDEKMILTAKNVVVKENVPKKINYFLYYSIAIAVLVIIIIIGWIIKRKNQTFEEETPEEE